MIRKIQSIHLYWFHACLNKLTCCLVQNMIKHYLRSQVSLNFESLVQNSSNPSYCSCISPTHSFYHVMIMHHIVALHWMCFFSVAGICPLSVNVCSNEEFDDTDEELYYLQKCQAGKTPLFIPIQSHSLAPTLFYCIRTTTIHLLLAAVAEPLYPLHDLSLPQ